MKKSILKTILLSVLAAGVAAMPAQLLAQSTNKPASEKKTGAKETAKGEKKTRALPFHGELAALDNNARTITVGKHTYQITSETKLFKGDKTPTTLDSAVIGEHLTGSYKKTEDGKFIAHSLYFGPKPEGKGAEKAKEK